MKNSARKLLIVFCTVILAGTALGAPLGGSVRPRGVDKEIWLVPGGDGLKRGIRRKAETTYCDGDARMPLREASHVHLVDDCVVPRRPRMTIVAPRERRIDHGRERRVCGIVAIVE